MPDKTFVLVGYYKVKSIYSYQETKFTTQAKSWVSQRVDFSSPGGAKYLLLYTSNEGITNKFRNQQLGDQKIHSNNDLKLIGHPNLIINLTWFLKLKKT